MATQSPKQDSNVSQQSGQAPVTIDEIMITISGWMKKMKGDEPSGPNMTFAEAGFDSLDSIELALFLQDELGVKIDETVLNNYPTFAALAGYLKERL